MVFALRFDARVCRQVILAAAALAVGSLFMTKPAAAQTTSTWTTCAQENQLCAFSGTRNVRYGANGAWTVRQVSASGGGVQCSNGAFGDPAPGYVKTCQLETVTTTTTSTSWPFCANENSLCAFSGTRNVRYGAGSSWVTRSVTASGGGVQCSNGVFGDPAPGYVKTCLLEPATTTTPTTPTTPTTTGWAFCANENALCSFTGTRNVRYGAGSSWVTRSVTASGGGVQCSNGVFGDPAPGYSKACQLGSTTTSTPTTPTTPPPTTTTGWAFCANENAQCAFSGTRRVRYGADSRWVTRDMTASSGGISCSNGTFGDPAPGTVKRCDLSSTSTSASTTPQPPTISGTPQTSITVGGSYRFQPTVSDPNGDTLAFSITNRPSWATFNTTNGLLTGQPTLGNVGAFSNIVIRVSDGTTSVSLPAFAINVVQDSGGAASLSWTPPTTNADGSALTNLAGYRIYYGTSSSALTQQVQIASAGVSSYVISGLNSGTYYFLVRAYNSAGAESTASNMVMKTIP